MSIKIAAQTLARQNVRVTAFGGSGFLVDAVSGAQRRESLALGRAVGKEVGMGWWDGEVWVGKGHETGVPQIEQDRGLCYLGVTAGSVKSVTWSRRP